MNAIGIPAALQKNSHRKCGHRGALCRLDSEQLHVCMQRFWRPRDDAGRFRLRPRCPAQSAACQRRGKGAHRLCLLEAGRSIFDVPHRACRWLTAPGPGTNAALLTAAGFRDPRLHCGAQRGQLAGTPRQRRHRRAAGCDDILVQGVQAGQPKLVEFPRSSIQPPGQLTVVSTYRDGGTVTV